ncbi:MAG: SO_0444 family Cu/Zn efflux transporter [Acidobacteriota bacterium]
MDDATLISALVNIVAESAPFLLFGFAAAGLLRALIPERRIYELLGEDSFRSVLLASLIGVPLPLCSCSVIPVATGLREGGAGKAATTSFLISTPETGVDSISITWALMDPLMTVARPLAAFITALATGSLVGLLPADAGPEQTPAAVPESCCCDDRCAADADTRADAPRAGGLRRALSDGLRYAFGPLVDDLAVWLAIGFLLAAAVTAMIPDGFFAAVPSGWVSSLLMMLVATPVYICASAATPIAAALILKGLDPGAALVLLLVGPATNVATVLVVYRFLGRSVLAVYLLGVTVCALAFGATINALYAGLGLNPTAVADALAGETVGALQAICAVVLVLLLAWRLLRRASRAVGRSEPDAAGVLRSSE